MGDVVRGWSVREKNRVFGAVFATEAILAMFPPVHWIVSGTSPQILGVPFSVVYFVLMGALITASVVAIYLVERARGELD